MQFPNSDNCREIELLHFGPRLKNGKTRIEKCAFMGLTYCGTGFGFSGCQLALSDAFQPKPMEAHRLEEHFGKVFRLSLELGNGRQE